MRNMEKGRCTRFQWISCRTKLCRGVRHFHIYFTSSTRLYFSFDWWVPSLVYMLYYWEFHWSLAFVTPWCHGPFLKFGLVVSIFLCPILVIVRSLIIAGLGYSFILPLVEPIRLLTNMYVSLWIMLCMM